MFLERSLVLAAKQRLRKLQASITRCGSSSRQAKVVELQFKKRGVNSECGSVCEHPSSSPPRRGEGVRVCAG